jgi:hypothetical protein
MVNDQIQALRAIAEQLANINNKLSDILAAVLTPAAIAAKAEQDPRLEAPKRRRAE